jgi:hypothetical protein
MPFPPSPNMQKGNREQAEETLTYLYGGKYF